MDHANLKDDYYWMARAIQNAKKGRFTTSPNPRVGCVIVDENNQFLSEGFHIQAGTPHAEIHALNAAEKARKQGAKGTTAYVTLEPCSHFGRTPPCALALVKAQVSRVVIGMTDPNPTVSGNGIRILQEAGIEVVSNILASEAAALNPGFIKRMLTGKPYIRLKMGISLDGKIALENGVSQWITGKEARRDVQRYRAMSCAVVTGSGTVKADNPSLLVRANEAGLTDYPIQKVRQPDRIIIDSKSSLNDEYQLFNDGYATLVATTSSQSESTSEQHSCQSIILPEKNGKVDLHALMGALGEKQYNEVLVEAGPGLAGALLNEGLVDELICYQAPTLLGDKGQSMVSLPTFTSLEQSISLTLIENCQVGNDIKFIFKPDGNRNVAASD